MNYAFSQYEDAILAALSDLKKENGGYLKALEGYAGQLDTEQALKVWAGRLPAVAVAIVGATYPNSSRSTIFWRQDVRVLIFAGAQSWRGQAAARSGAAGMPQILADIRSRLLNKTLGLEILGCFPAGESILASDLTTVIFTAEYQIINDRILEEK